MNPSLQNVEDVYGPFERWALWQQKHIQPSASGSTQHTTTTTATSGADTSSSGPHGMSRSLSSLRLALRLNGYDAKSSWLRSRSQRAKAADVTALSQAQEKAVRHETEDQTQELKWNLHVVPEQADEPEVEAKRFSRWIFL